jgi:predicted dehydrogenase
LWVDAFKQHATIYRDNASNSAQQAYWGSDIDRRLIADFCEAISQQRPPSISGEDGLKALEVALTAYRSAQTGTPLSVPLTS